MNDLLEVIGVALVAVAVLALTAWPWALLLIGVYTVVKAAELERRQ